MQTFKWCCFIFTHRTNMSKWATALWVMKAKHVKEHPFPRSPSQASDCRHTPICSPPKKLAAMISITPFLPPGKYYSLTNSLSCTRLFEVMIMQSTNVTDGTLHVCCSTVILSPIYSTNVLSQTGGRIHVSVKVLLTWVQALGLVYHAECKRMWEIFLHSYTRNVVFM